MQDLIPKGTGNSHFLKSIADFLEKYPDYPSFVQALVEGSLPFDFNGINPDGIVQMGTLLNKANLLTDETAESLGMGEINPTVNEAFAKLAEIVFAPGAGSHNAVYRGKYLGDSATPAQYAAIEDGTFDDLYIGDYWTIGNVNYRIAAFDYYLRCGNTDFTTHHAVIVPDSRLYNAKMNDTNTTVGGYAGSKMYTANLTQAKDTIKAAFNYHVLNHKIYLVDAVTDGHPSSGAWYDSEVDLMNEQMLYGGAIFMPIANGSVTFVNQRTEKSQLPLFTHRPDLIGIRGDFWLRDIISASQFALITNTGRTDYGAASTSLGVRPAFCIGTQSNN